MNTFQSYNYINIDLSFSVSLVSQFIQQPHESHCQEAKIILRYLQGTSHYGVFYLSSTTVSLSSYTDSDWAGDSSDRRSTAGYVFQLGSGPVSWSRKKVKTLYLSSCEAEYRAAKEAAKEAVWLRHVLTELGLAPKLSTALKCDNQGAIHLAYNLVYHSKKKHIDLDTHYICRLVADGILSLQYCPTKQQAVDIFTKSFTKAKFVHLHSLLGM